MDDLIYFDVEGDSTLQNLNTVIENENIIKVNRNENEKDFIIIDENVNKKKNKKKKKNAKKNKTYINPTYDRPIIVDEDVFIDVDNEKSDNSNDNIISSNAFDILNKTTFNGYMDDDVIKDYIENCKDDESEESGNEIKENITDDIIKEENQFLNSAFAKNIIKTDVGVETEPIEMEMDLIKLLENKLSSDSESSSEDLDRLEDNSINNKNNNVYKKNDVFIDIESNNIPIGEIEKAITKIDRERKLKQNIEIVDNNDSIINNQLLIKKGNEKKEIIEIEDDDKSNNDIDIITLLENNENNDSKNKEVISLDDNENEDDVVLISDGDNKSDSSNVQEVILIEEDDSSNTDDSDNNDDNDFDNYSDDNDSSESEDEDEEKEKENEEEDNIFQKKLGQKKILINDGDEDYLYDGGFEGGESTWNLDDKELEEKLKNSKFKAVLNSNKDQLLRLQKKKLQKKELAQKKEYLLQKKENLKKENKRIQKVLKYKKGNKLQTSPEVFKYLKHINTTIKDFVTNGFESIPLGNLPSELRKSVGMIAIEYGVKIKTRGSGKRKITNLIRTSRSKIPDNWNTIVETVFSKTEAQRHSNMDVRKRNLDMAKRRGKYHNNNNKGKSSVNKPELGSKVGENANPISDSNIGFKLLQSMGWNPGESLGNNNSNGLINPIEVVVRDQSGLGASYFDQGYDHSSSSSRGLGMNNDMDEYERDILYNSKSSLFSSRKNKKGRRFSNDNYELSRKSSRSSVNSKRSSQIGETGGLENSSYNFVNFQKSSNLFTQE
eukprot:jgi/Orpsp1_1/1179561/evm.model.c7180000069866.1